ncbi:hypothetical protein NC652_009897 [Populus alba x Populus x berolinensis]|nr:hypothetical protein NC652_009897 [Populus alba x Populus x berolinensis]
MKSKQNWSVKARSERKVLEEELMELNNRVAELTSETGEAAIQRLQDEIKDCKSCDCEMLSSILQSMNPKEFRDSPLEMPWMWNCIWLCIFYALLKAGLAGSEANPLVSGLDGGGGGGAESGDLGFSKWIEAIQGKPDKEAADKRKLVSKWHPTTKGTLRRNYRVPSKSEGQRRLKAIAALLSEDDYFVDATSHKGCQIRRESAHGESVCCNNVRALFDELPTPHLLVEITAFPAGPLTEKDYVKAEKLERVLRSGPSI